MKAIYIQDFVKSLDDIIVSDITIPSPPSNLKEPHYLIKVTHTSPTHVDTLYARGLHQNNHRQRGFIHPPFTLGTEFSGIIIKVYPTTSTPTSKSKSVPPSPLLIKSRVWGASLGTFAEYLITPHSTLHLIPPTLSLSSAAALGTTTAPVSHGALIHIAKLRRDETCLIHAAASGLGVAAVQIALAVGAKVIATVGSDAKVAAITQLIRDRLGITDSSQNLPPGYGVVNYNNDTTTTTTTSSETNNDKRTRKSDAPAWVSTVKALTPRGAGVDVVFDTVGLVNASISACAFGARIVVLGFVGRQNQPMETVAMNRVLLKQISVLGYRFGETGRRDPAAIAETWRGLEEMIAQGKVKGVVDEEGEGAVVRGLEGVAGVLKRMVGRDVVGKVVVRVADEEEEVEEDRGNMGVDEKMKKARL